MDTESAQQRSKHAALVESVLAQARALVESTKLRQPQSEAN